MLRAPISGYFFRIKGLNIYSAYKVPIELKLKGFPYTRYKCADRQFGEFSLIL